jgi:alpha-tubulin suppressor-like RCC1 family protein
MRFGLRMCVLVLLALLALVSPCKVIQVSVGHDHVMALTDENTLLGWGANGDGQIGMDNKVVTLQKGLVLHSDM